MLESTFLHIAGVGTKTERQLWERGIRSWDDFEKEYFAQQALFSSGEDEKRRTAVVDSRDALTRGDADYFADRLPKSEHYRIALTFPKDTYFVDIETTGLSHYYDDITIVGFDVDGEFYCHVVGTDKRAFVRKLSQAKCLVTFNGTAFDLKFLKRDYPELVLPRSHVDLRYFARSMGMEGGQKKIEQSLGIQRLDEIEGMVGEFAPLLWHQYRMGDRSAARRLVEYNHADVEGMKAIFDECISRLLMKRPYLPLAADDRLFSAKPGLLEFAPSKRHSKGLLPYIPKFPGKKGPRTTYRELTSDTHSAELSIVGIDLSGSEKRPSGWCSLIGNEAHTKRVATDLELFVESMNVSPDLVSIDSPLSMPHGRTRVTDDDPKREEIGIVRACEHELFARGVNVYPSLIPSMQRLTERGIRLAHQFRKAGIPVIESYPGAAQDIMSIPRKRAGEQYLKQGLNDFGINGEFVDANVSHDELDAITSAIVGLFFWTGMFEALGNDDEDYLIIPDLEKSPDLWRSRIALGFSGPIAAGKTTAAVYLKDRKKFAYGRYSLVLAKLLREKGESVNRATLQELGEEINHAPGQRWLSKQLVSDLGGGRYVTVDGLRFPEDHAFMVERFGPAFRHVHVDAPYAVRKERYIQNGGTGRSFERAAKHPVEGMVRRVSQLAHEVIFNEGSEARFTRRIMQLCK